MSQAENPYNTSIEELGQLINLPVYPKQAYWQAYPKGAPGSELGPSDWELVAILTFDEQSLEQVADQLVEQTHPDELFVGPDFVKDWFPDSIKQLFVQDDLFEGTLRLEGVRYSASQFTLPPLQDGYVLLADDVMLLHLFTL